MVSTPSGRSGSCFVVMLFHCRVIYVEKYSPIVVMLAHMAMLQLSIVDELFTATYDTISTYPPFING